MRGPEGMSTWSEQRGNAAPNGSKTRQIFHRLVATGGNFIGTCQIPIN
jgi:hypothetical protein